MVLLIFLVTMVVVIMVVVVVVVVVVAVVRFNGLKIIGRLLMISLYYCFISVAANYAVDAADAVRF